MNKFPVFKTIKDSFTFIFENRRHALKIIAPYALILIAIETLIEISPASYDEKIIINADFIIGCILMTALIILGLCAVALPSLAWQRAYLKGIAPDNQPHPFRLNRDEWRFIGVHTLAFIFLPGTIYGALIPFAMAIIPAFMNPDILATLMLLCIALPIASLMFALTVVSARFLIYLPAIAGGQPLGLKESFHITKGNALRLTMTAIITVILFTLAYIALNAKPMIADSKRAYEYGYQDEKLENERERQQAAGGPVTVPDELPNKADFADPPPTLIDFLFYIPANAILNLLSVLVSAGILAQFYKWARESRRR